MCELTGSIGEDMKAPSRCPPAEPAVLHAGAARPSTFCQQNSKPRPDPVGGEDR